ncbi:hypothetical protein ONE63_010127 [Megalurothrips usitatus]|uniref:Uncharacterized protein n=1 Tax=Megalurothrips usitatus TaxID=439358 RepID=A0AAV7XJN6_9NEOP|nr:hypothetical protein ONE63_010127 [Megalurothrips usitatus]
MVTTQSSLRRRQLCIPVTFQSRLSNTRDRVVRPTAVSASTKLIRAEQLRVQAGRAEPRAANNGKPHGSAAPFTPARLSRSHRRGSTRALDQEYGRAGPASQPWPEMQQQSHAFGAEGSNVQITQRKSGDSLNEPPLWIRCAANVSP